MTDPKRTCGNCDYFTAGANGHGTCHVAAPGSIARNGFPIIAVGDWCAKGATGGQDWVFPSQQTAILRVIDELHTQRLINADLQSQVTNTWDRVGSLMRRNLWQRICNTVPWEGK